MHNLFLLPLLPLLALGALIAWLAILMFELLCWMLSVSLEWLWQRRVEPVASISGHLLTVLDFVATAHGSVRVPAADHGRLGGLPRSTEGSEHVIPIHTGPCAW